MQSLIIMKPGSGLEVRREGTVDLCFSYDATARQIICGYLEEETAYRAGNGAVPVLCPGHGLAVVVDGDDKIDMAQAHAVNVLLARGREPFFEAELRMRMEIADDLEPVKTLDDRFYLLVAPVKRNNAFRFSVGCLKAEGVFDNETVLKPVAEQKTKAFFLVYLR